jgi:hypothetical protein
LAFASVGWGHVPTLHRDCPRAHVLGFRHAIPSRELYGFEPTPCALRTHILSTGFSPACPAVQIFDKELNMQVPDESTKTALSIPALNGEVFRATDKW